MHVGLSDRASRIINVWFALDRQIFGMGNCIQIYNIIEMLPALLDFYKNDGVEIRVAGKANKFGR